MTMPTAAALPAIPAATPRAVSPASAARGASIIAAAYDLLAEEGLEGLTIRSVLARSGLARRAFYESFAGKDDLVLAVFEQTLLDAAIYFGALMKGETNPLDRIRLVVAGLVLGRLGVPGVNAESEDRRGAALSREHLRLAESRPAELQAALQPLLGLIAEQVTLGISAGQFRACDPQLQTTLIYNLVATTVHTELMTQEGARPDRERRQQLADEIWEFCRRAIIA